MSPFSPCLFLLLPAALSAQAGIFVHDAYPNATVGDDDANGIVLTASVSTPDLVLTGLEVRVKLEGTGADGVAFNGDYYLRLTHTDASGRSEVAILMNRPGRTLQNSFGYDDNGFDVVFSDLGGTSDIHAYRQSLFNDESQAIPASGPLTGTWQPDGRETDPESVTLASPRTAMLSNFIGMNPNGTWTLFAADLSQGGEGKIVSWGLSLVSVPEPITGASMAAAVLLGAALGRRLQTGEAARPSIAVIPSDKPPQSQPG